MTPYTDRVHRRLRYEWLGRAKDDRVAAVLPELAVAAATAAVALGLSDRVTMAEARRLLAGYVEEFCKSFRANVRRGGMHKLRWVTPEVLERHRAAVGEQQFLLGHAYYVLNLGVQEVCDMLRIHKATFRRLRALLVRQLSDLEGRPRDPR